MKSSTLLNAILIAVLAVLFLVGATVLASQFLGKGAKMAWGASQEKVGVVEIKGIITESRTILKQLDDFRDNPSIKAIVLRINSPGGAVGPSQEILGEVEKIRKKKKVVASLGTVAASGAYYIASGSDLIMADRGTATGSIGVIMEFTNVEGLTKKIGLDFFTLKSGRYKDVGSPFRTLTPEEKEYMQHLLDNIYQQFLSDVARNRKIPLETLRPLAEGKIYTGEEAKEIGLVDAFGNPEDAIEKAGRLGGIRGKVEAVYPPKQGSIMNYLIGNDTEETLSNLMAFTYPQPAFLPAWFK
ncbi:MAG: signal peptide peptidase SppA [Desulfobaccales bacterium]